MSDFLLDLRPPDKRSLERVASRLRWVDDGGVEVYDRHAFGLVIAYTGDPVYWAPFRSADSTVVAVAGRLAFDETDWDAASSIERGGGLAAKAVYARYERDGAAALESLNGNFVVIVCDEARRQLLLATDYCGAFPAFVAQSGAGTVYGSHPDVLADAADERHRIDETSLAEFLLAGTVTPPFSFYERVQAVGFGSVLTHDLIDGRPATVRERRYFTFDYRGDEQLREADLADELAGAIRRAVRRRTLPRLGPAAVALSGGLDSRVVLASSVDRTGTFAFSCYDEPNREFMVAESIARRLSSRFLPLRRGPDYYAENAEQGVRISGGMGTFANNHFLGVIPRLKQEGMASLLTGCYCDYLFKGLPLNRRTHWLTRREHLAPFEHRFYFDHFPSTTALAARARERVETRVPAEYRAQDSPDSIFHVEARRTFPVCYEGDNQQRLVPQRTCGWSPPFLDRDVIGVYCRVPYHYKLSRSLFRKTVVAAAPELRGIPDANTAAAADASEAWRWVRSTQLRLERKWQRLRGSGVSHESWPDWRHYLRHSPQLDAMWKRPNADAQDLFRLVLGESAVPDDAGELKREQPLLFISLLSLKIWLDIRR